MSEPKASEHQPTEMSKGLEERARQRASQSPTQPEHLSPEETMQALHELRVHQIELEMQNEELRQTQAELDATREHYFDLYNLAPVGYITINESGLILEANLTAATMLGVPRSALAKQPISRFIYAEDQDIYYLHRKKLIKTGDPQSCELRMVKADGASFTTRLTATVDKKADDTTDYRIVIIDITERKRAEDALRQSEAKYRTLADFTYDWEFWLGPDESMLYCSPSCEKVTGHAAADFVNDPSLLRSLVHPDDLTIYDQHRQEAESRRVCEEIEFRVKHRDPLQGWRWIAHGCQPVYDEQGEYAGVRGSNRDVTERKQMEAALRESERHFHLALDATSDGVWDRNICTGDVFYGENWASLLGYNDDDIHQQQITWESLLHPDDKAKALRAVKDHLEGKTARYVAEFRLKNKAGNWQWTLARGKVVAWDEKGRPLRFVGTHTDISDRKSAEKELERVTEEIKFFAYSVAHDLKNPAIAIHGLANQLIKKHSESLQENGGRLCKQILRSAEDIDKLVGNINIFISTKEIPLRLEKVSLKETVQIIRDEFSSQLDVRSIKFHDHESLPDVTADRISILRVLRNFVDNALKYGGEKLSSIEVGYKELADCHILSVKDDGEGIKQEDSHGIFRMFKRKNNSLDIKGTGLGLAIVKEIAEQHQGKVWIEHGLTRGVTFCISISKNL